MGRPKKLAVQQTVSGLVVDNYANRGHETMARQFDSMLRDLVAERDVHGYVDGTFRIRLEWEDR